MLYRFFDDYKTFTCIAGRCPDSCCHGWGVEIDTFTLEDYRRRTGAEKTFLEDKIDWAQGCFRTKPDGSCSCLREDGLCQLFLTLGEDAFCDTCDRYPRHVEEFPNIREFSLSISCPEVAKQLLSNRVPLRIAEESDKEYEPPFEDFNAMLYDRLSACRSVLLTLMQDRSLPFFLRAEVTLQVMGEIQSAIDEGNLKTCQELLSTIPDLIEESPYRDGRTPFTGDFAASLFDLFFRLEPLNAGFRREVSALRRFCEKHASSLSTMIRQFLNRHKEGELRCEKIAVYFLYTYLCGAVYDEYVYGMTCLCIFCTYLVFLLWVLTETRSGQTLSDGELARILWTCSRELEHSTDNMILLEQLLDESW